jgi:hypothetical protein
MATTVCETIFVKVVPFWPRTMPGSESHCGTRASLTLVVSVMKYTMEESARDPSSCTMTLPTLDALVCTMVTAGSDATGTEGGGDALGCDGGGGDGLGGFGDGGGLGGAGGGDGRWGGGSLSHGCEGRRGGGDGKVGAVVVGLVLGVVVGLAVGVAVGDAVVGEVVGDELVGEVVGV